MVADVLNREFYESWFMVVIVALSEHGEWLACACDTIGKDSGIDALEEVISEWPDCLIEDLFILAVLAEDSVELEVRLSVILIANCQGLTVEDGDCLSAAEVVWLFIVEGANPSVHLEGMHCPLLYY